MEHIDSKQCVRHSAWRSPLKIGGVPPLAGRGYDNFLSVSLKFVGESAFSPPHSHQTPETA